MVKIQQKTKSTISLILIAIIFTVKAQFTNPNLATLTTGFFSNYITVDESTGGVLIFRRDSNLVEAYQRSSPTTIIKKQVQHRIGSN
jgi:hypothetical protein